MINVDLLREKVIRAAVLGKLSADYVPNATAKDDLEKLGITIDALSSEETPCAIKPGWEWVRVSNLGADKYAFADGPFGSNLKREHYTDEKQVRIIQLSNVGELGWKDGNEKYTTYEHLETIRRSEVFCGNIVIAKMMPAGRAIIVPDVSDAYVLSSDCVRFVPNSGLNTKYLCYAINSKMFRTQVLKDIHGIGRERTSLSKLKSYLLPIPPIDEQNIIVDRIDYAFDLINQIDALQQQFESDREILKGKIIDAGIRGKLTQQLPEDGNASDLYTQIQDEKAKFIKEGKIKKKESFTDIAEDEIPFEIPSNWKWVRLGDICPGIKTGSLDANQKDDDGKYPFFTCGEEVYTTLNYAFDCDAILLGGNNASGDYKMHRYNGKFNAYQRVYVISGNSICLDYVFWIIKYWLPHLKTNSQGMTTRFIKIGQVTGMLVPLPPLSEQRRIASIVETILEQFD